MTDKTETELLQVTQEDIAIALEHLGYDSVDDLHYWAENDTELRRFDELCSRFARHRLNTRPNQGHDALVDCHDLAARVVTCVEQATTSSRTTKERLVADILHPTVIAAQMANDLAQENSEYASALHEATNLPTPQPQAAPDDGLVADLQTEADLCRNEGADDIARLLDRAIAAITALRARPSGDVGWQPIETAPKNEDMIFLYAPSCGVYEGYQYNVDGDEWTFLSGSGEELDQPTHWQPLPEPPALSTIKGDE